MAKQCLYCGKKLVGKPSTQIFCSRDCSNKDKASWQRPAKKKRGTK